MQLLNPVCVWQQVELATSSKGPCLAYIPDISTNRPEAVECFVKAMAALQEPVVQACGIQRLAQAVCSGGRTKPFLPCVPTLVHAMETFGSDFTVAATALNCLACLAGEVNGSTHSPVYVNDCWRLVGPRVRVPRLPHAAYLPVPCFPVATSPGTFSGAPVMDNVRPTDFESLELMLPVIPATVCAPSYGTPVLL
jgi:hypothetical protein